MKLLILGGTVFLGRHLIDAATARGHEVTIFNRGQTEADVPREVERLRGDRDGGLDALRGRRWDAVVDTSGYVPRIVRESAELLAGAVEHYTFVSSISVYKDMSVAGIDETYPVGTISEETLREVEQIRPQGGGIPARAYGEFYGPLKALCERAVEETMPGRTLNVRAGLLVGPYDYSDRFTYWPRRVASGGDVLAPGNPGQQLQFVDARDLADWIVRMAEARRAGTYNATGPDYVLTIERLLEECKAATASDAQFVWMEEKFLLDAGVEAWSELPLWVAESDAAHRYFLAVSCARATASGLTFRPLPETILDTLAWDMTRPPELPRRAGLAPAREREILNAWKIELKGERVKG
ncbi:MAG TPA: NAD-dependent epimerase/dehydratase family protein [Pyrinomonadaceae bacterium]|nr:NAD-dependent epimerase/dehydratase family protein [Pyrinomonadaceae bacterium]